MTPVAMTCFIAIPIIIILVAQLFPGDYRVTIVYNPRKQKYDVSEIIDFVEEALRIHGIKERHRYFPSDSRHFSIRLAVTERTKTVKKFKKHVEFFPGFRVDID